MRRGVVVERLMVLIWEGSRGTLATAAGVAPYGKTISDASPSTALTRSCAARSRAQFLLLRGPQGAVHHIGRLGNESQSPDVDVRCG